jgi:Txe/YoeB family toxin of Txe-Axe toxin-antitoxin module
MIHNFMNYLKTTPYKGVKYKQPKQKSMKEEIEELLENLSPPPFFGSKPQEKIEGQQV